MFDWRFSLKQQIDQDAQYLRLPPSTLYPPVVARWIFCAQTFLCISELRHTCFQDTESTITYHALQTAHAQGKWRSYSNSFSQRTWGLPPMLCIFSYCTPDSEKLLCHSSSWFIKMLLQWVVKMRAEKDSQQPAQAVTKKNGLSEEKNCFREKDWIRLNQFDSIRSCCEQKLVTKAENNLRIRDTTRNAFCSTNLLILWLCGGEFRKNRTANKHTKTAHVDNITRISRRASRDSVTP